MQIGDGVYISISHVERPEDTSHQRIVDAWKASTVVNDQKKLAALVRLGSFGDHPITLEEIIDRLNSDSQILNEDEIMLTSIGIDGRLKK